MTTQQTPSDGVTNTSDMTQDDKLALLSESLVTGPSATIERQEAQGQRELVDSTLLPVETRNTDDEFIALGFTFGEPLADDPIFRDATLPVGWTKRPTEHSMWSEIIDERGLPRVMVFYKAAFYDRSAHMGVANVGREIASHFIYGDQDTYGHRPDLTDDEVNAVREGAVAYLADVERHPDIYGDRAPRARQILDVLATLKSLVPAHMCDERRPGETGFCPGGEKMQPGGRCERGCDHADHYSNDGHPECVDTSGEPR